MIAALSGQADLYTALRHLAADQPLLGLTDILAALQAGDAQACTTAVRLAAVDQGLLRAIVRRGRGLPATAHETAVRDWLAAATPAPLFLPPIANGPTLALLTRGEHPDMPAFSDRAFDDLHQSGDLLSIVRNAHAARHAC